MLNCIFNEYFHIVGQSEIEAVAALKQLHTSIRCEKVREEKRNNKFSGTLAQFHLILTPNEKWSC